MKNRMTAKRFFSLVLLACAIFIALTSVKTRYLLVLPGTAEDVLPMIHFKGRPQSAPGHLYLTTVYVSHANLLLYLMGKLDRNAEFLKQNVPVPHENEMEQAMMQESQLTAEALALRKAGYPVALRGNGVKVISAAKGTDAALALKPGDVVKAVDGEPTPYVHSILAVMRRKKPDRPITLTVLRGKQKLVCRVKTIAAPGNPGSRIGILVTDNGLKLDTPVPIRIDASDIEGSSAGLMFSLGAYDLLKGGTLAEGLSIAGTGTVDMSGAVGPIEGIRQKMVAARKEGADYFFCPQENYAQASNPPAGLTVIPVRTFDQALAFVEKLRKP